MELLQIALIVIHILGYALLIGAVAMQIPNVKKGTAIIPMAAFHATTLIFSSGIVMVIVAQFASAEVNTFKLVVKILAMLGVVGLVISNRNRRPVSQGSLIAIMTLATIILVISLLWR